MTQYDIAGDAAKIFKAIQAGGVAVVPLDVAYAVVTHSAAGTRKIYAAKGRSFDKPNGNFGNMDMFNAIYKVGHKERDVVSAIVTQHNLPFSVVARFNRDHPFFAHCEAEALERSTKGDTLDMLLNAGALHNELAALSWQHQFPLRGSSANRSLSGSKFRLQDVEPEVLAAADICIDHGLSKYHNPEGISSTIVDLTTFKTLRFGVCYEQIRTILKNQFAIELAEKPTSGPLTMV